MAADLGSLIQALTAFYDFTGKTVLLVGAGGGQLLEGVSRARRVVAIDPDAEALGVMAAVAQAKGMAGRVEPLQARWEDVTLRGDVVYFEFCLHEMADPAQALAHARALAPEVVVFDHQPDSPWARCAGEAERVRRSAEALGRHPARRRATWSGEQRFADHAQLWGRLSLDPRPRPADTAGYESQRDIRIPMDCGLTLL